MLLNAAATQVVRKQNMKLTTWKHAVLIASTVSLNLSKRYGRQNARPFGPHHLLPFVYENRTLAAIVWDDIRCATAMSPEFLYPFAIRGEVQGLIVALNGHFPRYPAIPCGRPACKFYTKEAVRRPTASLSLLLYGSDGFRTLHRTSSSDLSPLQKLSYAFQ